LLAKLAASSVVLQTELCQDL